MARSEKMVALKVTLRPRQAAWLKAQAEVRTTALVVMIAAGSLYPLKRDAKGNEEETL